MIGRPMRIVVLFVGLLCVGVPARGQQAADAPFELGVRALGATHLAGLDLPFSDDFSRDYRMEPAAGLGATAVVDFVGGRFRAELSYERIFGVSVTLPPDPQEPRAPDVRNPEEGNVSWLTAALRYEAESLCGAVCPGAFAGAGVVWYDLPTEVLSGDIGYRFASPGAAPSFRIGIDATLPGLWEPLRIYVADYAGEVEPSLNDDSDYTLHHVLVLGLEAMVIPLE